MSPTLLLLAATAGAPPAIAHDLKVPPDFTARLYADNPIAPDIYTMTIDDDGRVLVAGRGYVRVLVDEDGDGSADRAVDLIDGLKDGPMGLLVEGDSLFVVSDGGLKRYRGYNGKDKLRGPPETLLTLKATGEHDAHMVRRGPDGWLYLLCGNSAGVRKQIITSDRSPVKDPIAGALVRLSPDFKQVEVVADGFRNPYSFDFNLDGEPFTYDSDNERCVGLPWYEGCRFYHIVPSGNHGWRSPQLSQMWRKPPYFPDVVPPICDTGRGSPTGVACYRHTAFPEQYRGGFFIADWTFGRIYHVPLKSAGSSYRGKHEVFTEAIGTSGFAPTALAVHPKTGELFVSIGGRGTRGGVYRISYNKADANPKPLTVAKRSLDFDKDQAKQWIADCTSDNARTRRLALETILRWWDKVQWGKSLANAVKPNLSHDDRLTRQAAGRVGKLWFVELDNDLDPRARLALALEAVREDSKLAMQVAISTLRDERSSNTQLLMALRIIHLAYGDLTAKSAMGTVWEGYTLREPIPRAQADRLRGAIVALSRRFKKSEVSHAVAREVTRMFAILGGEYDATLRKCALERITSESAQVDDFHYLIVLACATESSGPFFQGDLPKPLLSLVAKVKSQNVVIDTHWPIRFAEMLTDFGKNWPKLRIELLNHPDFGQPDHVAFAQPLGMPRDKAASRFLAFAATEPGFIWTPGLVELASALPEDVYRPLFERLWKQSALQDAIIAAIAKNPRESDTAKILVGLGSYSPEVIRASALALMKLSYINPDAEIISAIKALRRLTPDDKAARVAVSNLLGRWTGAKVDPDSKSWTQWVTKNRSDLTQFFDSEGFDANAWQKRLAGIDWSKGNAERGGAAFAKATCAACHDGGRAVGPSLLGISKRFSREDLLTAILQPSKDVSARYRPTRIVTTDEKAYLGIIIYEATDGVILQTGADTTVRIAGADIASKKPAEVSLMPAGLLDKLSDAEIADLLAYLGTLGEPKPK